MADDGVDFGQLAVRGPGAIEPPDRLGGPPFGDQDHRLDQLAQRPILVVIADRLQHAAAAPVVVTRRAA